LDKQFFVFQMDGNFGWGIRTALPYSLTVWIALNRPIDKGIMF